MAQEQTRFEEVHRFPLGSQATATSNSGLATAFALSPQRRRAHRTWRALSVFTHGFIDLRPRRSRLVA